jgi:Ca-activated chloride channel family protein
MIARRLRLPVSLALAAAAGFPVRAQVPDIRVDVRLVRILATVKNAAGQLVGSLEKDDFRVYDNGVPQQIAVFERHTEQPLSVSVLIDTSGSTAKELRYETESVSRFLKALFAEGNPADTAALYSFNYQVVKHNHFTRNHTSLERSLKTLKSEGGTSLYDALYLAAGELGDRDGRHVIVVVTDGGDTTSAKDFHGALEAVQLADAVIYPVLVMPIINDAGRNIGGENALATFAARTGGRVFLPQVGPELDKAFAEIIKELRTQYLLAYYPKNVPPSKDRFHRLRVEAGRSDLRVLARSGYYGETDSDSVSTNGRVLVVPEVETKPERRREK